MQLTVDSHLIGIRIMQRRKEKGLTQEELSEKVRISKNHLSSIERGKNVPTTQFIIEICNVLGGTPDYYLIGKVTEKAGELTDLISRLPAKDQETAITILRAFYDGVCKR